MTLEIGKPYRLPDGRKGLYVGAEKSVNTFSFMKYGEGFQYFYDYDGTVTEQYREPRTWEDDLNEIELAINNMADVKDIMALIRKLIGRAKVVVQEGGE